MEVLVVQHLRTYDFYKNFIERKKDYLEEQSSKVDSQQSHQKGCGERGLEKSHDDDGQVLSHYDRINQHLFPILF